MYTNILQLFCSNGKSETPVYVLGIKIFNNALFYMKIITNCCIYIKGSSMSYFQAKSLCYLGFLFFFINIVNSFANSSDLIRNLIGDL